MWSGSDGWDRGGMKMSEGRGRGAPRSRKISSTDTAVADDRLAEVSPSPRWMNFRHCRLSRTAAETCGRVEERERG